MHLWRWLDRIDKAAAGYVAIYLPIFLWVSFALPGHASRASGAHLWIRPLVAATTVWWGCCVYMGLGLLLRAGFRERVITRLAGFRERDEREEIVAGRAARATFLIVFSCVLLAAMFSMIGVETYVQEPRYRDPKASRAYALDRRFFMWPVLMVPGLQPPVSQYREIETPYGKHIEAPPYFTMEDVYQGDINYTISRGAFFDPETSLNLLALAALMLLTFHFFAVRYKT